MNRDDIIRMAQEAGLQEVVEKTDHHTTVKMMDVVALERFAALVAAAEREACAKLCDEMERRAEGTECCKWPTPADCSYAIRARGEK